MGCGVLGGGGRDVKRRPGNKGGCHLHGQPWAGNEEEEEKPKERRESVRTVVYVYAEANGVKERERDGIFPWRVQPRGKGMSTSTDQIRGVGE